MYKPIIKSVALSFFLFFSFFGYSQLTITVNSIPSNTLEGTPIYIVGSFNNWNPDDNRYLLTKTQNKTYKVTFTPVIGTLKFKFTQGSWSSVEGNTIGGFIPDRTFNYLGGVQNLSLDILGWEGQTNQPSTASPNVMIHNDSFYIPQLDKKRRIWVYTPPNYNTSNDSFQVLYMHDGQNLFDDLTSFSGEWAVDESLDSLHKAGHKGIIVVGIDNGGGSRIDEYSPWLNPQYGGGKGDLYIEFIIKTLMPEINKKYRVLKGPDNTGIMGSSMGGLISMYAGLKYPEVFGKVGAFSSSYWFSNQSIIQPSLVPISPNQLLYLIAGAKEGSSQVQDMQKMANELLKYGIVPQNLSAVTHVDANHSEWYWKREFPSAYKFLFEKKTSQSNDFNNLEIPIITQKSNYLVFDNRKTNITSFKIFNLYGNLLTQSIQKPNDYLLLDQSLSQGGIIIIQLFHDNKKTSLIKYIHPF